MLLGQIDALTTQIDTLSARIEELIAALPDDEREVVGLLFYQELPQAEAAALLHVTVRTVQRRWQSARFALHEALQGEVPE